MQTDSLHLFDILDTPIFWIHDGLIEWMNSAGRTLLDVSEGGIAWDDVHPNLPSGYVFRLHPYARYGKLGVLVECLPDFNDHLLNEINRLKSENQELERIFNASLDEVFVTDANGITVRVNETAAQLYGMKKEELIGKSVYELEKQRVFHPSVTSMVLKEKKRITVLQTTKSGRRLIASANPVFDESGSMTRVVTNAKDVTDVPFDTWFSLSGVEEDDEEPWVDPMETIVAASQSMRDVLDLASHVAATDATVLLLGETGVGKNRIAEYIHRRSPRNNRPFVHVNCAAIPETLMESELFGYESGAFTGANRRGKPGQVELADGGTLFLDEIGELPLPSQAKLLEFVQQRAFTRVGGTRRMTVDTRIIAATNRDLNKMVRDGQFRADLYYRLCVIPITIPPLRERPEDIDALLTHALRSLCARYGLPQKTLTAGARALLRHYHWPGNVRELENLVERLVITHREEVIGEEGISPLVRPSSDGVAPAGGKVTAPPVTATDKPLKLQIQDFEREVFQQALTRYRSTYAIAKALDVSQPTVVRKLKQYGLR
jgi:PAS domain S-box-containing protein